MTFCKAIELGPFLLVILSAMLTLASLQARAGAQVLTSTPVIWLMSTVTRELILLALAVMVCMSL